jgi:hypothetical protein
MDQFQAMRTKNSDNRLLILQVIHEYCKKNISTMRRFNLKELCNNRLSEKTGGQQQEFGGSFQRCLNDLENDGMLKRIPNKEHKQTVILFNKEKIEYFLLDNQQGKSDDKADIITEAPFDETWEQMIEEVYSSAIDKGIKLRYQSKLSSLNNDFANKSHFLMTEYTAKSIANMMSRTFEFNISYPDGGLKLDRQFFKTLVNPLLKIVQRDVSVPFKVEIDYKGFTRPPEEELTKFEPKLLRIKAEYFEKWTREVFNYQISEWDKRYVDSGLFHMLDRPASEYYAIFHKSTVDYTNLLHTLTSDEFMR